MPRADANVPAVTAAGAVPTLVALLESRVAFLAAGTLGVLALNGRAKRLLKYHGVRDALRRALRRPDERLRGAARRALDALLV